MKLKLLYVLPEWEDNASDHSAHVIDLLREIASHPDGIELSLVIERGRGPVDFLPTQRVTYLDLRGRTLRGALRVLVAVVRARAKGCNRAYVHYSFYGGIIGGLVMRLTGGRLWYWNCAKIGDYLVPSERGLSALRERLFFEIPLKLTLRLATYFVTGTASMARHYVETMRISPERILIMANWVNLRRFAPQEKTEREAIRRSLGIPENTLVVLFVHRLAHRKGADLLPELAENIGKAVSGVYFVVVGDGPLRESLGAEVARRGLENRFCLLGPVPNREILALYHAADLFIMPSREEGFPRVLLEAMAAGVPFVATDVGGVREITIDIQHTCLVPCGDLAKFADRIVALLNNEPLREKLAQEGLHHVQQFSLHVAAARFLRLISNIRLPHERGFLTVSGLTGP